MTEESTPTQKRHGFIRRRLTHLITPRPNEQVDQLGMPIRLHYGLFSCFSLFMSAIPLASSFTPQGEALSVLPIRLMCFFGLLLVPAYWIWGKRVDFRPSRTLYHFAAMMGVVTISMSAIYVDDLRGPMAAALLTTPISTGYFLELRDSWVWVGLSAVTIIASEPYLNEPESMVRVAVLLIVMVSGWLMLATTKIRLISVLEKHRQLSETDPLTGSANVRRLQKLLDDEVARSDRGGDGFDLIEFDLDEFKQTNDRYSHSVGDRVLVATADAVKAELAASDVLVRRGGDEFTIVAPHIPDRDVDQLCGRIGDGIARARNRICPELKTTASIGWTTHRPGESAEEVVLRADGKVHESKAESRQSGRTDRLGVFHHGTEPVRPSHIALVPADGAEIDEPVDAARQQVVAVDPIAAATSFAWKQAAALFVVVNVIFIGITLAGATSIELDAQFYAMEAAAFVLAPVCWWLSKRPTHSPLLTHLLAIGTLTVITISGLGRGDAAVAGVEIYLVTILFQMYLLPLRTAFFYAFLTMCVFAAVLSLNGYAGTGMRVNTAVNTMGLLSVVLAFSRRRTIELATENANLARIDALTGLPNVRRLRDRLEDEIKRASSTGTEFSVLMLDLDDFKRVNDVYDHTRGDTVLACVADAIAANVRRSEMPARRGGDEFAIVLTDAGAAEAELAVRRFAPAIKEIRASLCADIIPTASIGFGTWSNGDSVDDLLAKADASLHQQKMHAHEERRAMREALAS